MHVTYALPFSLPSGLQSELLNEIIEKAREIHSAKPAIKSCKLFGKVIILMNSESREVFTKAIFADLHYMRLNPDLVKKTVAVSNALVKSPRSVPSFPIPVDLPTPLKNSLIEKGNQFKLYAPDAGPEEIYKSIISHLGPEDFVDFLRTSSLDHKFLVEHAALYQALFEYAKNYQFSEEQQRIVDSLAMFVIS